MRTKTRARFKQRRGLLVVLSSPSGAGKTTVVKKLCQRGGERFTYSISATTRPPRADEVGGRDYSFISEKQFKASIERGEFAEWAEVHGFLYGTPKSQVEKNLALGKVILLDIDVKGGLALRRTFPEDSLLVFVAPPSLEVLEERLRRRGSDSEQAIQRRLARVPMEMKAAEQYDIVVVNDDLDQAIDEVWRAIQARLDLDMRPSKDPAQGRDEGMHSR